MLTGPGNTRLDVLGVFEATLELKDKATVQPVYVLRHEQPPLLGFPAITALGIATFVDPMSVEKPAFLPGDIFEGLGEFHDVYTIKLRPDAQPFSLSVPRRIPLPLHAAVKKELLKMKMEGVIRRIDAPTEWCAGIVVVPKPSGDYRICVDLTKLNQSVLRERHVLPSVEIILGSISQGKVFSKLDATAGFQQVKLAEESQEVTTFITPLGRYCFQRLPFGICSAPEYYQRQMSRILEGMGGVVNMIDDILVFGRTKEEHDRRLHDLLQRLRRVGVKLNKAKFVFAVPKLKFLCVVVGRDGISPHTDKVGALKNLQAPSDVSGVRRLLGMINHVGRFLPNLSKITAPIRQLLTKTRTWYWGPDQQKAFQSVKDALTNVSAMAR